MSQGKVPSRAPEIVNGRFEKSAAVTASLSGATRTDVTLPPASASPSPPPHGPTAQTGTASRAARPTAVRADPLASLVRELVDQEHGISVHSVPRTLFGVPYSQYTRCFTGKELVLWFIHRLSLSRHGMHRETTCDLFSCTLCGLRGKAADKQLAMLSCFEWCL